MSLYKHRKLNHHEEFKQQVLNVLNGATGNWDLRMVSNIDDNANRYALIADIADIMSILSIGGMIVTGVLAALE